ncbi:tetratricopeptide repeat protein [Bradyrhizobium vignae]|uniref:Tetratricopeptide repeat protein n=1 Tax=Bradyrhizobium vignae TaxID=1549949 RepID=A0ABS3ZUB7_9BRAD|nr:tetratricopeptide repeat protein [Bradyrhizobium vignae]MBP0111761.1 tetratricopeptide repeat protein [Bradyrhizobium vignae]
MSSAIEQKLAEIARLESEFGPHDLGLADALEDFALWYADNRIYSGAEPYFRRSLEIREHIFGADIAVADALERWAKCAERSDKGDAQTLFSRSLAIRESLAGPMSLDLVPCLDALAGWYQRQFFGRDQAVSYFRRSLEIVESHGAAPAEVACRVLNISRLLLPGRPAEAEPLLRRALAIHDEQHAPDDAELVATLDALVGTLIATGRHDDIGPLIARSLNAKAVLIADQPAKLFEVFEAAIETFATYGRVEDFTSTLRGGVVDKWPHQVKLLLRFAHRLLQHGREADMNEVVRLGVGALQETLSLEEDDRFDALWELWPGFSDDDFRQMSEASGPGIDRVAHALGSIAAGDSITPPRRWSPIVPGDKEIIEIDGSERSPDDPDDEDKGGESP